MAKPFKFRPSYNETLGYWTLNIPPVVSKTGKRARLYFKTKEAAWRASDRLKERHKKFGTSLSNLDPFRLGEASEVYKRLDAHKKRTGTDFSLLSVDVRAFDSFYFFLRRLRTRFKCHTI